VTIGVLERAITSEGLRSREPTADNNTPEGRKRNRRVERVLTFDYRVTDPTEITPWTANGWPRVTVITY